MEQDIIYMKRALELAAKGRGYTNPNPMVGAVIVKNGKIIGEGYHERCGEGHAEVNAFRNATEDTEGADIYVTLEPCSHYGKTPPCADLIVSKKIKRAIIGALDPNPLVSGRGIEKLKAAGIEVVTGVLAEESIALNEIFMKYIRDKEPFVLAKWAMSLDGKIACHTGDSQWISCEESRNEVQQLRHQMMGILVGVDTVITDNPRLTCRLEHGKNPVRIIADSNLRIPMDATVLDGTVRTIIITTSQAPKDKMQALQEKQIELLICDGAEGRTDLPQAMKKLGQMGIDSILLEGGGSLMFSAIQAGIVDKVCCYTAPKIIGGASAKTPVEGMGFNSMKEVLALNTMTVRTCGTDVVIEGYLRK